jgi:hypothetical protein
VIKNKYKLILDCSFVKNNEKDLVAEILDKSIDHIKFNYDHYHKEIKIASIFSVILLSRRYSKFSSNDILYYVDSFFDYYNKNFVEYKKSVELLSTDFMFEFEMIFYKMFVDDFVKKH